MVRVVVYIFVTAVALWSVAWYLWGDANWLLYCLNRFAPFLYIPGLIVPAIVLIISRRPALTLLCSLPAILFVLIFWSALIPRDGETNQNDLRVMTYNVLCSNNDIEGIARVIRQHSPDLVALQEVTENQFKGLSDLLESEFPYRYISYQVPCGSTAVFSRLPVSDHKIVELETDRPAMLTTVMKDGNPLIFVSAHLLPMYYARIQPLHKRAEAINGFIVEKTRQVEILIDTLNEKNAIPAIIGCDCNTVMTHSAYKTLSGQFTDSALAAGKPEPSATIQRNNNPYQLDYIFYRGSLQAVANYRLADSAGSDHRPVMTHFAVDH